MSIGPVPIAHWGCNDRAPNDLMAPIHTRMPVVIGDAQIDEWLAPRTSIDSARAMCLPCPSEWLAVRE